MWVIFMKDTGSQGCCDKRLVVSLKDLPLCCPLPKNRVWDAHPRVYLPIERSKCEICPYCGTEYILDDEHARD